jgi:hypothetical protein
MSEGLPAGAGIVWALLGAAYAATWVWLGVRLVNRRERWAKWTAAALAAAPVLYVLSSGPMTILAFRSQVTHTPTVLPDGTTAVMATSETGPGKWFPIAYAPLILVAEQPWGEPIFQYWEFFFLNRKGDGD